MPRCLLSASVVAAALVCGSVAASADTASDQAVALALFNDARALAAAGDYASACPKLEAADRLTGWLGVELNLADCYARTGRTASAWGVWRRAAAKAETTHDDRAAYAHAQAEALEPQLAHIAITPRERDAVLEVRIDTIVLAAAELGTRLPIDPGEHVVTAGAPGQPPAWTRRITVAPGASLTLSVDAIPRAELVTAPRTAPASNRWLTWSLAGTGAVLIGTSAWIGLSAKRDYDAAVAAHCDAMLLCTQQGRDAIDAARTRGTIATVVGGLGVASAVAAIVLVIVRHDDDTPRTSITPTASATSVGLAIGGTL